MATLEERFWSKVEKSNSCWLWTGATTRGYGIFHYGSRNGTIRAHRFSYQLSIGAIPEGLCVCHACDTPLCVNPEHLFLGSQATNMVDMNRKGRGNKPGEDNFAAVLTNAECAAIISACLAGAVKTELAKQYLVHPQTIHRLWRKYRCSISQ